jgi:hypothetical protein
MAIPWFPDYAPLAIEQKNEMEEKLKLTSDGISEFTFSALFSYRKHYNYMVSWLKDTTYIISGIQAPANPNEKRKKFFMTPCAIPDLNALEELFKTHDFWMNIPESILLPERARLEEWGIEIAEDRDNFDYLYLRTDLVELAGKKFHKKRNLLAQFSKLYIHEEKNLTQELIPEAMLVLESWRASKDEDGDYIACREALEHFAELDMQGLLFYIDGKPAGWCMGEPVARGRIFTVHFEKGLDGYKGIYQFMNKTFAATLPASFTYINREQDLGNDGMRQAKMTYRPSGFVRKYTGHYRPVNRIDS